MGKPVNRVREATMAGKKGMKRRTKAEVEAVREATRQELEARHPRTVRRVHYRLVSRPDVNHPNTQNAYNTLTEWLRDDRLAGIIPWHWIVDSLREPRHLQAWPNMPGFLADVRQSYHRDVWADQPTYLECWCEKDADAYIFVGALEPYRVTLNVGRGYDSWTALKRVADRFGDGIGAALLCFGDFDPSGEDMVRSLQDRLATLGCYPEITKHAVMLEDIAEYDLAPDFTKTKDSRAAAHVARYGDVAVELDALDEDVLERRVVSEVEARMDLDALERTLEQESADTERLNALIDTFSEER